MFVSYNCVCLSRLRWEWGGMLFIQPGILNGVEHVYCFLLGIGGAGIWTLRGGGVENVGVCSGGYVDGPS